MYTEHCACNARQLMDVELSATIFEFSRHFLPHESISCNTGNSWYHKWHPSLSG